MNEELLKEVLVQLKELDDKVSAMAVEYAVHKEHYAVLASNFKEQTKHIEDLMNVLNQGKTTAKLVAALIAFLAGIGATWDWIVAHIRIM